MFRLTIETIRARKARFLLTAIAVMLGVAFVAGTFVLTDTIGRAYDGIAATKYDGTDVLARSQRVVDDGIGGTTRGSIPAAVLDDVRHVDGVAAADASIEGVARLVGHDGRLLEDGQDQATPIGLAWQSTPRLNPLYLVAGHAPVAARDIVIDRASAEAARFGVGDTVQVSTRSGSAPYTVAGIATYGSADDAGGAAVVAFTPNTAMTVLGEPGRIDGVQAVADTGVSQPELVARVRTALADPTVEVMTGTAALEEARAESRSHMSFMSTFLLTFAIVAVIVGGFVIFNAFSITVAQRTKETAMLRAIGASRRQVVRMVVLESVAVGVVASAIGTVLGIGLATALRALLETFGLELPSGPTVVSGRTIVVSMIVGTVVTVSAAFMPARKASKVAPIAALRTVAVDSSGHSVRRVVIGAVTAVVGTLLLVAGLGGSAPAFGAGALAVFAAVVVLGPVVASRFTRLAGAPIASLRGMTGVLARDNASRNPKRTAATSSALMIGVALVVLISVFAASARTSIQASVDTALRSDWVVTGVQRQDGLSPTVAREIDALPETGSVTSLRSSGARLGQTAISVAGVDPAHVSEHLDANVRQGSFADLGDHGLAVQESAAEQHGWHLGDEVVLTFAETGPRSFTIAAVYSTREPFGEYVLSQRAFDANVAHPHDDYVMASNATGVTARDTRVAIERVLADSPAATLHTPADFKQSISGEIDRMLNLIYVLLFLAVVIALFGIANTLALSVVERKRELGLLRAVGMQRSQVRAGVRWEAALIALLGTALGTLLGVGFGWVLVTALAGDGIDHLAIPVVRIAVVVVVAALAAVGAAALPARRAARLDVLESIAG